jgi:pre-mRNA-processing factor 17
LSGTFILIFVGLKEEQKELDEILAKRNKKGKQVEEKPLEEKSILHRKF